MSVFAMRQLFPCLDRTVDDGDVFVLQIVVWRKSNGYCVQWRRKGERAAESPVSEIRVAACDAET